MRLQFGCDKPASRVVFRSTCPVCFGARWTLTPLPSKRPDWPFVATVTPNPRPDSEGVWQCVGCGGTGEVGWKQCPRTTAGEDALALFSFLTRARDGVLPTPGAWGEQTAWTAKAYSVAAMEWSKIEQERREIESEE